MSITDMAIKVISGSVFGGRTHGGISSRSFSMAMPVAPLQHLTGRPNDQRNECHAQSVHCGIQSGSGSRFRANDAAEPIVVVELVALCPEDRVPQEAEKRVAKGRYACA